VRRGSSSQRVFLTFGLKPSQQLHSFEIPITGTHVSSRVGYYMYGKFHLTAYWQSAGNEDGITGSNRNVTGNSVVIVTFSDSIFGIKLLIACLHDELGVKM
jgi:hypothetical protein